MSCVQEMLETWKKVVFQHISLKLLSAALRLVEAERNGEAVDAHLVIGVRESWGKEIASSYYYHGLSQSVKALSCL